MRQHPRPTYGKARGQWPPQLDKGDSSAQFHGQMESARRLSLTVEFSAPLRCVWQRVSLAREIFFMQGMKNGTECTLSRENETLPGAKPDSERNRYDPCTTERRRPRRPPKRAGREKGGAKTPTSRSGGQRGTSTWWYKIPAHGERARCNFVLHNAILLARAAGGQTSLLVCSLPSHGLTHNGGLSSRRFTPLRCILALTVPVVRGLATPFLLCRRLARGGLYGRRRHWINRLFIYLSATLYYRNWPLSTLLPTPMPRPGSSLR